ncbi:MAG: MerR family transcriptional regulator [Conexibacteraceae bacterium]|nr:MerR family transcriptional regulator [Conexibacteraceae bacterium]
MASERPLKVVASAGLEGASGPEPGHGSGPGPNLTVEQLASRTGMSVRYIRHHQSRGLLPPPEVRARIGYYGEEHVARLSIIQELQALGLKLSAIERVLDQRGPSVEQFLGLKRAVTAPPETESSEVLSGAELTERLGELSEPDVARAQKLGLFVAIGDDLYEAPSPRMLQAAEQVMAEDVAFGAVLDLLARMRHECELMSKVFVRLFLDEVWKPFDAAGRPSEGWPRITAAIERLRPLASDAMLGLFQQTMAAEVEQAFGRTLSEQAKRGR